MSDVPVDANDPLGEEQEDFLDMGEPIGVLADFQTDASSGLVARIRRTIHRRTTTVQLLSFSWSAPSVVLKEFWLLLIDQTNPRKSGKDGRREGKTS